MGGFDPVVVETTWTIYDCIDCIRALHLKSSLIGKMLDLKKGLGSMPSRPR